MQVDESEPYGCQDNFLDELTSFMPDPDSYNLDDLDELLRATDSHLDSSLNFNTFPSPAPLTDNFDNILEQNGFNFNLSAFPSPATTNESQFTPPYESERTSSISDTASDVDNFNPDDFINFLEKRQSQPDEDVEDIVMNMPDRHTPSPTSSCSSSTSGVHSDASSQQMETDEAKIETPISIAPMLNTTAVIASSTVPITLPLLQVQPLNVLLPIKTMPVTTVTPWSSIPTPVPLKVEPKLAPKATTPAATPISMPATAAKVKTVPATGKMHVPINAKPKTIYLSSNDFKALMQRMKGNGKGNAISGSNGSNNSAGNIVQLPKIIMKTPNGKVITTNKVAQNANIAFAPKISKHNGAAVAAVSMPNIVKTQQQAQLGSSSNAPDINFYKGIMDEKMFKKQQRMIKNRESASLSRKKKKEYVVSLESRINNLEKENYTLKGENTSLRSQLAAFAQSCQCKNGNVSEFVLNTLSMSEKGVGSKSMSKNFKQRMSAANMKKNVAVLFAMAFMVTLNVGNFQTYLNKQSNNLDTDAIENIEDGSSLSTGRRLLWVETETEFKEKQNRSKRDIELQVPPLHFLHPKPRNSTAVHGKTEQIEPGNKSKCGDTFSNQTENMRLASSLHKWIGGNDYLNLSTSSQQNSGNELTNKHVRFKLTPDYFQLKSIAATETGKHIDELQTEMKNSNKQGRRLLMEQMHYESKKRKLANENAHFGNSLEVFQPKISDEYLRLFKSIKRQDDTFYVLSFNMDHLLLPASAYNKSSRPKMSLMLPAGDPSMNGDIVLMQIDCEVVNTTELALKSDMIPEKLRPQTMPKPNDMASNDTFDAKPIKVEDEIDEQNGNANATINGDVKAEPRVRTYFMMGPKSQAAMVAGGNKDTAQVKLSPSKNVITGSGILNIKNSPFFSKMQETVAGDLKKF